MKLSDILRCLWFNSNASSRRVFVSSATFTVHSSDATGVDPHIFAALDIKSEKAFSCA